MILDFGITVRLIEFPYNVKAVTLPGSDSECDIHINSLLSQECRQKALKHELEHIRENHFYDYNDVAVNEMLANAI